MIFKKATKSITRLLVVEDEPLIAFDNEYALEQEGYEVVATVDNAADALTVLEVKALDAVLLDINLAGEVSGVAVAEAAHARGLAVILLSGNVPSDAGRMAHAAIGKPYSHRDLMRALSAVDAMRRGEPPGTTPATIRLFG